MMGGAVSFIILIVHTPCAGFSKAGARYRVPGIRVPGTWDLVPGTGSTPRTEYRAPKTEPGPWKTRTLGVHHAYLMGGFSKTGDRYWVPDSVSGLRFSALGLEEGRGKVASPLPLIPPWPMAEHRGPSPTRIAGFAS
jgi:hypothetical protein